MGELLKTRNQFRVLGICNRHLGAPVGLDYPY